MTSDAMTESTEASLLARVAAYYTDKIHQHGSTPRGVDWRDVESQEMRFASLLRIIENDSAASLIELGCGYGALYGYLIRQDFDLDYLGYDISEEMVTAAKDLYPDEHSRFMIGSHPRRQADYCVASGIFNVRFDLSDHDWRCYLYKTLDVMAAVARKGFAFNCLTSFSDRERQESRLFYGNPGEMLNHCIKRYGRRVALLHGRPPYEFTLLIWHGSS